MPAQEIQSGGESRLLKIAAWICGTIAVALWTGPTLLRADIFNGDATQHIYWLYRYADPALFPHDLAARYFASDSVAPWGYRALYCVLARWADAQWISEVVAAALLAWTLALAWRLGAALVEEQKALAGLLAVGATSVILVLGDVLPPCGFQRTFALPITLLCLFALVTRRYGWVGVSWLLSALIYPIMIPVLGLTAGVVFLGDLIRERRMPPFWIWNGCLGGAAIALVLLGSGTPADIGPMVSFEQAMRMPEFSATGRQDLFGQGTLSSWFRHHRTGLGWSPWMVLWIAMATAIAVFINRRSVPRPAWIMMICGVALWFIARLTMFTLYLPNRHSRMAIAVFAIVVFTAASYALVRRLRLQHAAMIVAWLVPLIVSAALWSQAAQFSTRPIDQDLERAYAFIRTLPKDTVVTAQPDLANDVPLRTRRSVLASTEESIAFMLGYHSQLNPRLEASLRAAYASSWSELQAALAPFDTSVMLSGPQVWQRSSYYPPFDSLMRGLWSKGGRDGFVLQKPPANRILFRSGEVYVLSVGGVQP